MKKYKEEKQTKRVKVLDEIQCDVCKKHYSVDDGAAQEILHIEHLYGYFSAKFGDMNEIELDMCEDCVYDMLGPFCHVTDKMPVPPIKFPPKPKPEPIS